MGKARDEARVARGVGRPLRDSSSFFNVQGLLWIQLVVHQGFGRVQRANLQKEMDVRGEKSKCFNQIYLTVFVANSSRQTNPY